LMQLQPIPFVFLNTHKKHHPNPKAVSKPTHGNLICRMAFYIRN
jgi:hypothetical protein